MAGAAKVGSAILVFLGLLLGAYFVLGKSIFAPKLETYYADFPDAGGVNSGSRVLLSGVAVGSVSKVALIKPGQARMTLELEQGTKLPTGTIAVLAGSLIGIGDRQVELTPPTNVTATLSPGDVIPGKLTSAFETLLPNGTETMAQLNKTLASAEKLLGDEGMKSQVRTLLASTNKTVTQFGQLAQRFDGVLAANQAKLGGLLDKSARIMSDMADVSARVAAFAKSGKLEKGFDQTLAKLDASIDSGHALVEDLRSAVNDPEMRTNMKEILSNTKQMTESGTRIAANVDVMSKNGIELSKKAVEIADKASDLADDAKDLLRKFKESVGKIGGGSSPLGGIEFEASEFRETRPNRWRSEFSATFGLGKDKYVLGLWDAFESNKLTLQAIKPVGKAQLRYGVFASKPGVGVDFPLTSRFGLRGDVFDVNKPRFDLKASMKFGDGLVGWLGLERIFERNAPSIGFGIRR